MIQLINIQDVRKYRQLSKQVNSDNFNGRVLEVQDNQLSEFLGDALFFDLFDFLENNWTAQISVFTRITDYVFECDGDFSALQSNSLRINSEIFSICESAFFDGIKTTITITGYVLPEIITILESKIETKYLNLLNGCTYLLGSNSVIFRGLRPFLIWNFLVNYTTDGDLKHADVGNVNYTGELFQKASKYERQAAVSGYLQNSIRENNRIVSYLNENSAIFDKWEQQSKDNLAQFDFIVI